MNKFVARKWEPITDLPSDWAASLSNSQTKALVDAWLEQKDELQEKGVYKDFLGRLKREWSIETGVIEGIYTLTEGATKTLIEKGLDASFLARGDTDDEPQNVIAKIEDHQSAINGLYDFVSGKRQLGTSYIKELHVVLTDHQRTYHARDTLGNWVVRDLPRGEWKKLKNNVEHTDGAVFEFCPPEHVDQEMENLVSMHLRHLNEGVSADIEAAWLHHRFSIIHPFTDGNGRVARCIATMVLLRENWLPLVVTRQDREKYIEALRFADANELRPLIDFVGALQRKAIRQAFSLSDQVISDQKIVRSILDAVKAKFADRRQADHDLRKHAATIADSIFAFAKETLAARAEEIAVAISAEGKGFTAFSNEGERDAPNAKYYYRQIIETAKGFGYFANLNVYQAWTALVIKTTRRAEILLSFHGAGTHSGGVYACSAMFFTKDVNDQGDTEVTGLIPLGDEPFEFTYTEQDATVRRRFIDWIDDVVIAGLQEWQKVV